MSISDTIGIYSVKPGRLLHHLTKPIYEFITLVQLPARNYRKIIWEH